MEIVGDYLRSTQSSDSVDSDSLDTARISKVMDSGVNSAGTGPFSGDLTRS